MATRGSLIVGKKRYYIAHDAYPRYTARKLRTILKKYKPKSSKEFIKLARDMGIDIEGEAPKGFGWPHEEYRYKVNLRKKELKWEEVKEPKKKKKVMDAGHTKVRHGHYIRSDTGKTARYSFKKDLKEHSKYLPARGKPMTGDNKKILYDPSNAGRYIVLARYSKKKEKWVPVQYEGKATVAKKKNKKLKGWKVGYV